MQHDSCCWKLNQGSCLWCVTCLTGTGHHMHGILLQIVAGKASTNNFAVKHFESSHYREEVICALLGELNAETMTLEHHKNKQLLWMLHLIWQGWIAIIYQGLMPLLQSNYSMAINLSLACVHQGYKERLHSLKRLHFFGGINQGTMSKQCLRYIEFFSWY